MSQTYGDILHQIKEDVTSRMKVLQENIDKQKKNVLDGIDAGSERNYHIAKTTVQVNMDALDWQKELLIATAKVDASIELPRVCQIQPQYHNSIEVQLSGLDPFGKNHGGIGNFTVHTNMERILNPASRAGHTAISKVGARMNKSTLFLLESGAYHSIRDHFHPIPQSHIKAIINKLEGCQVSLLSRDDRSRELLEWKSWSNHFEFTVESFGQQVITIPCWLDSVFYTDKDQTHLWARSAYTVRHIIGESVTE